MSKIIMIAGGIGSGKAYQMSKLVSKYKEMGNSVCVLSFADEIKRIIQKITGLNKNGDVVFLSDYERFVDLKGEPESTYSLIGNIINLIDGITLVDSDAATQKKIENKLSHTYLDKAIRDISGDDKKAGLRYLMQVVGTEIGQTIKKNIWPEIVTDKIHDIIMNTEIDYFIIDDWRFMFEFNYMFSYYQHSTHEIIPFYVNASEEIRANRRNISVELLRKQSEHASEIESKKVLLPFMEIYYPENIINGEIV